MARIAQQTVFASAWGLIVALDFAVISAGCSRSGDHAALAKINGPVHVAAGGKARVVETINGNISIDANATVSSVSTINGAINLGKDATARSLSTVNGNITLGERAHVSNDISAANGLIALTGANVDGGIETVNANISIYGASHVRGGIHVKSPGVHLGPDDPLPRIEIGPGVVVNGNLSFDRDVRLYVSERAAIGTVIGNTPIPFAGDAPANN
jgi:hypothetical protein